jgi:hypothetical protein
VGVDYEQALVEMLRHGLRVVSVAQNRRAQRLGQGTEVRLLPEMRRGCPDARNGVAGFPVAHCATGVDR